MPGRRIVPESTISTAPANKAVEMICTVPVQLRHQYVGQAVTPNQVVQNAVHPLHDESRVIPIHLLLVQCEGNEMAEAIRHGKPPKIRLCPAHTPRRVVTFRFFPFSRAAGAGCFFGSREKSSAASKPSGWKVFSAAQMMS